MTSDTDRGTVRLAELVAALSLGIDLGFSQPMEHVLRQCLIALRLAERVGAGDDERAVVYYAALLVNVGCHTDAHEQAKWFGDDIALKSRKYDYEPSSVRHMTSSLRRLGAGRPPLHRLRIGFEFATSGYKELKDLFAHHAEMAAGLAQELELPPGVRDALLCAYESWDGRGWPNGLRGDAIPRAARIVQLAEYAEVAHRLRGLEGARSLARERSGKQFDPSLTATLTAEADAILDLGAIDRWEAVIEAEPALTVFVTGERFDAALEAVANYVDLKSPYFLGHSRAVADLSAEAATLLGWPAGDVRTLRRAGLAHDFGRLGVSNAIWDKPGPLGAGERERVWMHPYFTQRMLRASKLLAPVGAIAAQHCERIDGSGYPQGDSGSAISRPARILAAADAYQAMREPRPYRPELSAGEAANELRADVKAGRFDAEAADAVLGAIGHRVPRRREGPAGLTTREIEVLRLVALGLSNKQIGARLVISPKTAGNHVEHIYAKIDASTRAAASLFAMRHGLLGDAEFASQAG